MGVYAGRVSEGVYKIFAAATDVFSGSRILGQLVDSWQQLANGERIDTTNPVSISGATNASPIVITTSSDHQFQTNDTVVIGGVGGNLAANGTHVVTRLSATTFSLNSTTGNGAYGGGGTAQLVLSYGHWNFQMKANKPGLVVRGFITATGNIVEVFDHLMQPIFAIASHGGLGVFGDDASVYKPGTVVNPVFRVLGSATSPLSSLAGAILLGVDTGQVAIYAGTGATSGTNPSSSPVAGGIYIRKDSKDLYRYIGGVWTNITTPSYTDEDIKLYYSGDTANPEFHMRAIDGTLRIRKGDSADGGGVVAIGNASSVPTTNPDGTHTINGHSTIAGILAYARNGLPFVKGAAGHINEVGIHSMRKEMSLQKDAGVTTLSSVGVPAPVITANATSNADGLFGPAVRYQTSSVSGNAASITPNGGVYGTTRTGWNLHYWTRFQTDTDISSIRYWVGLFSASPTASADPAAHIAAFRYSTDVDGTAFWRCCTKDGTTINVTTTTQSIATGTAYELRIVVEGFGTSIKFYINDSLVATHTTNLPTNTQGLGVVQSVTTLSAAVRGFFFHRQTHTHI